MSHYQSCDMSNSPKCFQMLSGRRIYTHKQHATISEPAAAQASSLIYGAIRTPCSVRTKAKDVLFIQGKQELMALQASSLALAFGSADDRAQSAESFWAAASCSLHPSRSLSVLCTLKFCTSKFFAVLTCPHLQECSCPSVESMYGDFAN